MGFFKEFKEFWQVLSENKIMKVLILLIVGILMVALLYVVGSMIAGKHIKLAWFEINDNRDTALKHTSASSKSIANDTNNHTGNTKDTSETKSLLKPRPHKAKVIISKPITPVVIDTSKSIKYNLEGANVNNSAVGDNAKVYNYGFQPIKITSADIDQFEQLYPNKSIHIGFVAPAQTADVMNVKEQIKSILKKRGYTDIEDIKGIRLMLNDSLSTEKITLLPNAQHGASFYIPAGMK
jgi:hypothetical protein